MTLTELARKLRPYIEKAAQNLLDKDALEAVQLFPLWKVGVEYAVGQRVRYNEVLYIVLTAHTSQADWTPEVAPSLFAKVLIPDENVIPEWEQPDSTNPYKKGDKVSHNGKIWESQIDGNVWEPGVVGTESLWVEVTE